MAARYDILVQGVNEMHRVGLISDEPLCYWHEHVSNNEKNNSKDLSFLLCEVSRETAALISKYSILRLWF